MIVRGDSLEARMSQYLVERIRSLPNIRVRLLAEVAEAHGQEHLQAVTIRQLDTGALEREDGSALFIFIGARPQTGWLPAEVQRDSNGFVLAGPELMVNGRPPRGWPESRPPFLLESSVPGIFVVGDVRAGSVKRVASAVGEGSIAVQFIHQYLSKLK
jgi:thioredoxin reductase (NADPH)